jgi:hypothetical protein
VRGCLTCIDHNYNVNRTVVRYNLIILCNVPFADPDPFDTDTDPDPAFHIDMYPDPAFQFDTDPDPCRFKEVMYLRH